MYNDYVLFFNTYDKFGLRSVKPYMEYLHHHDMYDESEFTSEQIVKPDELEVYFGNEPELLRKNEAFMLTCSEQNPTYTKLFGLEKNFIPTVSEIELIRSTWISSLESAEPMILNHKFFKEEYNFNYRKPKEQLKPHSSDEEIKYCAIQKAAIMLHDFYFQYDVNYRKSLQNNNLGSTVASIDELYERINDNAVADLQHVKALTDNSNKNVSKVITDLLEQYCITHIDWLKKAQELTLLGAKDNIDVSLSREELIAGKALTPDGSTKLDQVFKLMQEKYDAAIEAKRIAEEKAKAEEEARQKAKHEENLKKFDELKNTAKELGLRELIRNNFPVKEYILIDENTDGNPSWLLANMDYENNLLQINEANLNEFEKHIQLLKQAKQVTEQIPEKKGISRIDEYGENQIDWKSSKPNYVNDFKYEKNTPYPLRGRKQFCCWRTVWRPSGKKLTNERGVYILDADGNPQPLPLYDRNGNIVYDENGNPVPDGKWTKVPVNPNIPFNPEKPHLVNARTNDPRTWGTFDEACKAVRMYGYEGIGIMLGNSVIGIDVDHVIGADGRFTEEALDIIDTANSYTELSPSKTGLHILMFGEIPPGARSREGNLEIYGSGRFFTLTGDVVEGIFKRISTKQEGTKNVGQIYEKYMPNSLGSNTQGRSGIVGKISWGEEETGLRMLTNEEIIDKLIAQGERRKNEKFVKEYKDGKPTGKFIKNPFYGINFEQELLNGNYESFYPTEQGQSVADYALCSKIWYYTYSKHQVDEIFRSSGLMRDKWDEYRGHNVYGQITIENMVAEYKGGKYNPNYRQNQDQIKKQAEEQNKPKKGVVMDE